MYHDNHAFWQSRQVFAKELIICFNNLFKTCSKMFPPAGNSITMIYTQTIYTQTMLQIFLFTDTGLFINIFEWTIFHTHRTIVWCQRENIMWNWRNISAVLWWNQREFQVYANSNFFAKINPYKRLTKYRYYFCYVVEIVHVDEYA